MNLAVAAQATLIVTRDNKLLNLMDAGRPEANQFQARFPFLRILNLVQFLHAIRVER